MDTQLLQLAQRLSVDEQLELVEALWDGLVQGGAAPLTAAQKAELDRRAADLDENPDDLVAWSAVKAAALARLKE